MDPRSQEMSPPFSSNADHTKNAILNWRTNALTPILNLQQVASGYFIATKLLLNKALSKTSDNATKDGLIFPILTNFHHGIELYLKATYSTVKHLNGASSKVSGNHDIRQLLGDLRAEVKKFVAPEELKSINAELTPCKDYIDSLYKLINPKGVTDRNANMDFSRYTIDKDGSNHIYVNLSSNVYVDLEYLLKIIRSVERSLDQLFDYFYHSKELNI